MRTSAIQARWIFCFAIAATLGAGGMMTACSSGDDSSAPVDASADVQIRDVAVDAKEAAPVGCAPELSSDFAPTWVPPVMPNNACTPTQVQSFWDDCMADDATSASCSTFYGVPGNSPCIRCMITASDDTTYGAVIEWSNTTTNIDGAGCIALTDGDYSSTGCAAKYEAFQQCEDSACEANCPVDDTLASYNAYVACEADAGGTICKSYTTASACVNAPKYAHCNYASYEAYVVAYGNMLCAAGGLDAGADAADAGSDADDAGDGG